MSTAIPCPYCGSLDLHRIELPDNVQVESDGVFTTTEPVDYVHCNTCGASGPQYHPDDLHGWEAWNTRAGMKCDA